MKYSLKEKSGFTLIELLVVIAVIGILAAVVLASLSSARDKGKVAAIKSNLRNMVPQAELYHSDNATYGGLCTAGGPLQPMMDAITVIVGAGNVKCYATSAIQDRDWGVATTYDGKNYAVNSQGVVTFDTVNTGATATWDNAMLACGTAGKRLPSVFQLKALYDVYGTTPTGFSASYYWSVNEVPTLTTSSYIVYFLSGVVNNNPKTNGWYVRCVS